MEIRAPGTSWALRGFCLQGLKEDMMSERELIDTGTDKRFVRRDKEGRFKESDDVGRSLSADQRQKAQSKKPRNQGDKGD
jgi:hypothetical protein